MTTKDDFKLLLGSTNMGVDVKYGGRQWSRRISIVVTANEDTGCRLSGQDRDVLLTRVIQYNLNYRIISYLVVGSIPKPPTGLCTCDLLELLKKYKF